MKAYIDLNKVQIIEVLKNYGGLSLACRDTLDYDNIAIESMIRVSPRLPRYELRVKVWNDGAKRCTYGIAYLSSQAVSWYVKKKFDLRRDPRIIPLSIERITIGYRLHFDISEVYKK